MSAGQSSEDQPCSSRSRESGTCIAITDRWKNDVDDAPAVAVLESRSERVFEFSTCSDQWQTGEPPATGGGTTVYVLSGVTPEQAQRVIREPPRVIHFQSEPTEGEAFAASLKSATAKAFDHAYSNGGIELAPGQQLADAAVRVADCLYELVNGRSLDVNEAVPQPHLLDLGVGALPSNVRGGEK
eukprot:2415241-Prymnesium_polylepis.1